MSWIMVGLYMAAAVAVAHGLTVANHFMGARPPTIVTVLIALTWPIWLVLLLVAGLFVRPK